MREEVASKLGSRRNVDQGVPFRSTPTLPGAISHWISGGSRGGEQTQTAPLLKYNDDNLFPCKKYKIERNAAPDPEGQSHTHNPPLAFTTQPASCVLSSRTHTNDTKKNPGSEQKNPDFYDTCDAGALIGKLPRTESTLAQSEANIATGR